MTVFPLTVLSLGRTRAYSRFILSFLHKKLTRRFTDHIPSLALCTTMILRYDFFCPSIRSIDTLAKVLEREKNRNLNRTQNNTATPHDHAPGWNEALASASEAAVKVGYQLRLYR